MKSQRIERIKRITSEGKLYSSLREKRKWILILLVSLFLCYTAYQVARKSYDIAPMWSPSSTALAFTCYEPTMWEVPFHTIGDHLYSSGDIPYDQRDAEICVQKSNGKRIWLTHNRTPDYDPIWSPDGSQIAFISKRDLGSDIYLMKQDGTGQTRLTHTGSADSLVWSPVSNQICYRSGNYLWLVDVNTGLEQRLTNNTEMEGYPVWSPNGKTIAFLALEEGQFDWWTNQVEIRLFELDTQEQKVLGTASPGWTLAWSPDGTHLAFVSPRREYQNGLYSVNVQTLEVTQLVTEDKYIGEGIVWSVDGRQIFYIATEEIYAVEIAGGELSLMTTVDNMIFAQRNLVLSPDGHLIALMRTDSWESSKIWVVDIEKNLITRASSGW